MFSKILPTCFIVASGLVGVLSQAISPGRYTITNVAQGSTESRHTFVQPSSNSNNIVVAPSLNDEGIAVWDIIKSGGGFIMQNVQKRSFASAKNEPFAPVVVGDATEFEIQTWDNDSYYYRICYPGSNLTWTVDGKESSSELPIVLTFRDDRNAMWNFTRIYDRE